MNARIFFKRRGKVAWLPGHTGTGSTDMHDAPSSMPAPETLAALRSRDRPGSWAMSSVDLAQGVDVLDNPDTISDELFDQLFVK